MSVTTPLILASSAKGLNIPQRQVFTKNTIKLPALMLTKKQSSLDAKQNFKLPSSSLSNKQRIKRNSLTLSFQKKIQKKKKSLVAAQLQQKFKNYKQFLKLVCMSNNIQVNHNIQKKYILYVGKGNNSSLIKNIFRTYRPWWNIQEFNSLGQQINLYWFQLRQNSILQKMQEIIKVNQNLQNSHFILNEKQKKNQNKSQETNKLLELKQLSDKKQNPALKVQQHSLIKIKKQSRTISISKKNSITKNFKESKNIINFKKGFVTIKSQKMPVLKLNQKRQPQNQTKTVKNIRNQVENKQKSDNVESNKQLLEQKQKPKKVTQLNPKLWPIYHNLRKIFNTCQIKQLKTLQIVTQQGKIYQNLTREDIKSIQNKSNSILTHNHLVNNWNLSNKKALFMNLKNYYESKKENPFHNIPMTFHIKEKNDKEFQEFQKEYERRNSQINDQEKNKKSLSSNQTKYVLKSKKRNAWIIKPGENTNRGNGIEVVESLQEINAIIQRDNQQQTNTTEPRTHIIQEYILPFLYQRRKFDIRTYILITSVNGCLKGYWYQDGYIRTACKQFSMKNLSNKFIHLTNDAVQKHHQDYGKFQPGNKISYADFQRYLDLTINNNFQNYQNFKFWVQVYPEMKKLAADAIKSTFTKFDEGKKQFSFQIFGLDFLIDQNFKVWLIEANTNPCLQISCPLLGRIIPPMLQNAFKIVIDPIFPPPAIEEIVKMTKKVNLPDNLIQSNKFQLIFDGAEQGKQLENLLRNAPQVKINNIEQEQDDKFQDQEQGQNIKKQLKELAHLKESQNK